MRFFFYQYGHAYSKLYIKHWCSIRHLHKNLKLHPFQKYTEVLYLRNTERGSIAINGAHQVLNCIEDFGIRSVQGGFQRRPELIRQRQAVDFSLCDLNFSYGLSVKNERIQHELSARILELLGLNNNEIQNILDVGCGFGWSLTVPCRQGYNVTGVDLDWHALSIVQHKIKLGYLPYESVHLVRMDASQGLCFKANSFDAAFSISFLQWLCIGKNSRRVLDKFFHSLSFVLKPAAMAGIQFYPRNISDVDKVLSIAEQYFKGAMVSDFPHLDRGKKLFLLLLNNKPT